MATTEEILAESTKAAQEAARAIGGTFEQGRFSPTGRLLGGFIPSPVITSAVLTPSVEPSFEPAPTPTIPVAPALAAPELSDTEKRVQTELAEIRRVNLETLGEGAYKKEQEAVLKVPELQKTERDLVAQLQAFNNEANQIRLQYPELAKGITQEFAASEQGRLLRNNAIAALSIASLLESSRGNLATANKYVEDAVEAKFGDEKREIDVKTANLNLLLKDPAISIAEKQRAEAQITRQNEAKKKIDMQEDITDNNYKLALDAIKQASEAGTSIDALTLQNIQKAETAEEGLRFYNEAIGGLPTVPTESVVDIRQARETLANLLGQVAGYASREEAIAELDKFRSSIVTRIGEDGFTKLQAEVDRIFPPPPQEKEEKIGETGGFLGTVGNFFSRLFGF